MSSRSVSVVVCGAGAAGMAAAIAAARAGATTTLVESQRCVGGTVAHALIHTLGGLFDPEGNLVNPGLPAELINRLESADSRVRRRRIGRLWVLSVAPETYQRVAEEWLRETPRLTVLTGSRLTDSSWQERRVEQVAIVTPEGQQTIDAAALIDATGGAHVVRSIAPDSLDCNHQAAAGLVVRLAGVKAGALDFPKGVGLVRSIRTAADAGELPPHFAHTWLDCGADPDEVYIKLFLPQLKERQPCDTSQLVKTIFEFLRSFPGFENAVIDRVGVPGIRDGGRIRGDHQLTIESLEQGETSAESSEIACFGSWPIEYWDPENGVQMRTLSPPVYPIPLSALQVQGWDNLWAVGKCLSADPLAQSSARVVGTCWAMGEAVGNAAARITAEEGTCEPR
ncbi:FAD-dependent oxidoreductase [Rubinisphaera margarita]|uniref:FAD-dependent oxidoreductase n=1 Tax=Rubinisphaera margarita TaxID=2909586 RepID=UPI001EE7FB1E|nr:FAD-dependent oxidoreductase [Rubinisphaera margarita]MCG6156501.1 FAD-dependent oxidoreductase [Rubinisphaera margarita]